MTPDVKSIAGASGIGDAVYLYPIVKHFLENGDRLQVKTKFPFLYVALSEYEERGQLTFGQYGRDASIYCNYVPRKRDQTSNQFEDMANLSGLAPGAVKFHYDYPGVETGKKSGPVQRVLVILPRAVTYLREGHREMVPTLEFYKELLFWLKDSYQLTLYNCNDSLYDPVEFQQFGQVVDQVRLSDFIGMVADHDVTITQPGNALAFSEGFGRKTVVIQSARSKVSSNWFLNTITPAKIITDHSISSHAYVSGPKDADRVCQILSRWAVNV